MQQFRASPFQSIPPVVKNLLIINGLFFVAKYVFDYRFDIDLAYWLGLHVPQSHWFMPHQLVTHMFMHGPFIHIFFNMFGLWMFGSILEHHWGSKRFLIFYMVCGLGAAGLHGGIGAVETYMLEQEVLVDGLTRAEVQSIDPNLYEDEYEWEKNAKKIAETNNINNFKLKDLLQMYVIPTVGASGAIFGIFAAFGLLFPNTRVYIYALIPARAGPLMLILIGLEIFLIIRDSPTDNVAHFAHLGGALFGFILVKIWQRDRRRFY